MGVAIQQLHHVCGIPDVKQGEVEVDVRGSWDPDGPVADPPRGVGVRKVRGIHHRGHGRVIPTTGANQSVEDDDPAITPTGLGVVPKADAAALSTGCLPVLPVIRVVSTEASVARLYPGKLEPLTPTKTDTVLYGEFVRRFTGAS